MATFYKIINTTSKTPRQERRRVWVQHLQHVEITDDVLVQPFFSCADREAGMDALLFNIRTPQRVTCNEPRRSWVPVNAEGLRLAFRTMAIKHDGNGRGLAVLIEFVFESFALQHAG